MPYAILDRALHLSKYLRICVHWDMDGTLVDSEPLHVQKHIACAAEQGVFLSAWHFENPQDFLIPDGAAGWRPVTMPLHGAGDINVFHWVCTQQPEIRNRCTLEQWLATEQAWYLARAEGLTLREGVASFVQAVVVARGTQSIVTSATRAQLQVCESALAPISAHISGVITVEDVEHHKPSPEGYLKSKARATAEWLERGVPANLLFHVAIEDSPTGVRAAQAAGLSCVHFVLPGQVSSFPEMARGGPSLVVAQHGTELSLAVARLLGA